ncbi:MAG: DMT family transporter [Chloroflexi bacterium]|nr:DMT family transporter [Chloroflexota bacterium]
MNTSKKASLFIILGIGLFSVSTASLFIRLAQVEAPSLVIAAGRLTIATVILSPFVLKKAINEIKTIPKKSLLLMIFAGIFLGLHFASWISSLGFTSVASSVVLGTTAPLWVALFAPFFLKEKITKYILVGLVISLTGSVIVAANVSCEISDHVIHCIPFEALFQGNAFIGNSLALVGAFFAAGYLMVGRKVRDGFSIGTYTFIVYGIAALVLMIMVLFSGQKISGYSTNTYFWIFMLALIPQLVGHSILNYLLKYLSAAYVSIALLGEPVGTVILALIFLQESPTLLESVGGVLILIGIAYATKKRKDEEFVYSRVNDRTGNLSP